MIIINKKELEMRQKFWEKVSKEFEIFKKYFLSRPQEEVFDNAHQIAILSDFKDMCSIKNCCFSKEEVEVLLKESFPLHLLHDFYQKTDVGSYRDLYEAVWYPLRGFIIKEKDKSKNHEVER